MTEPTKPVLTLYEWIGGLPAIEKLFQVFYADKVPKDPLIGPVSRGCHPST